jgi:hypothetical protein
MKVMLAGVMPVSTDAIRLASAVGTLKVSLPFRYC